MHLHVEQVPGATILAITGRLDSGTADDLDAWTTDYLSSPAGDLIMDFGQLDYISSAGLRVILKTAKGMKQADRRFAICSMQAHIREVFEISGFDALIRICASADDFLAG